MMSYATTYRIGRHHHARTTTTTAIAPTVGRVLPLDAKTKRRKRSTERQTEIRTDSDASNGFLRCNFLPKLKLTHPIEDGQKTAKTERDFYSSLSKLAKHYNIDPMLSQGYSYPYNIVLAMWDVEAKLKNTNINWDSLRLMRNSKKAYLVSDEKYDTGTTLYYVPVIPLFIMLHDKKRKQTAQLLLSVCSYLYHIANIPYYREEYSYLYWQYEMLKEWIEQDDETEEAETYKNELRAAESIGDRIEQKLYNRINLKLFEQRLNRFVCRDTFDRECWQVAYNALALYMEYPTTSIFRNAPRSEKDPYSDDYENETIGMEKYISFVAHTKGWLYESISDCINNEFNEYGAIEEPTIVNLFDGNNITASNLDLENRLFAVLNDLCKILHNYKMTVE